MSKIVLTNGMKSFNGMKRILLLVGLAIAAALPAQAADYVISYTSGGTTYYLGMDGTDLVAKTQFDLTCIWQGYYNGDASLSDSRINIRNKNNTSYYLYYYDNSFIAYTSNQRRWYGEDGSSIYYSNGGTTRYIHNDGSTITASNSATGAFVPYQVTTNNVAEAVTGSLSTPAITPSAAQTIEYDGSVSYTASATGPTRIVPAHTTYTFNGTTIYYYNNQAYTSTNAFATNNPAVTYTWALSGDGASALELMSTTGENTIVKYTGSATGTTATLTVTAKVATQTRTASVTINVTPVEPTAISATNATVYVGNSGEVVYTLTPDYAYHRVTATSGNTGIFTVTSPATSGAVSVTPVAAGQATLTLTALNSDGSNGPSTTATVTVRDICAAPEFSFALSGSNVVATITCATPGATIRYTTDGTDPTPTTGTAYSGPFTSANGQTIKAIAVLGDYYDASEIVTKNVNPIDYVEQGVSGGVVTLNDLEDHTWTYYSGVSSDIDGGNYNTNYLGKLYSPNPRNVKITYKANGGAVSIDESETEFVYYKTLEQGATTGQYPYTVISNPFSKRPNGKGFGGWRIKEGADYINGYADEAVLPLDADIVLANLPYPTVNCISAEIVFEATWVNLNNITYASGNTITYNVSGGNYETNILVLNRNVTGTITTTSPVTIMMVEPDGSSDYRGTYTFTSNITPNNNGVSKIEFASWNPNGTIDARGRSLTIGRGMTMGSTARALVGTAQTSGMNQVLKVESGRFSTFTSYTANPSSITKHWVVLGCDYDRAKGDNSKLEFTGRFLTGEGRNLGLSSTDEMVRVWSKSGSFMTGVEVSDAAAANSYYLGITNDHNRGHRYMEIEGGEWYANITGGMGENHSTTDPAFTFRMKGGIVRGSLYGAAAWATAAGLRTYVITGGAIRGWVAGGANGTSSSEGATNGTTYIYVGGKAEVNSNGSTAVINRAVGGNVFGAGCGYNTTSTSGQVTYGTNVVVADNAYVERGVYGGGSYGYCSTTATSNIYICGGTVDGQPGGVNGTAYLAAVDGGVYGGACQNKGGNVNINMVGGTVNGSVYGGSNYTGTLSGTSTVTLNGGTVNGSLYGGGNGKGSATNVDRAVQVTVNGGTVTSAVYGCGNVSGAPQSTVNVDVYGTDAQPASGYAINQVFGGGNQANYSGTPQVTVHCGTDATTPISIGEVYGGGNQATVTGTNVTIGAGNIIGDVYGGGRQANVGTGGTSVTVTGGTIGRVFGGNNISGTIASGTADKISVTVDKTGDCPMKIGQVFGGGNQAASQVGSITIGCTGTLVTPLAAGQRYGYDQEGIGAVYGGANNAGISGDITLNIVSGIVDSVFGGNNAGGAINGDITVNVNKNGSAACASDWYVGYVFGGGNMATYSEKTSGHPAVNVKAGKVTHHVFGGGNGSGAAVTGNPTVTLSGTAEVGGNVFGGGNAAAVTGNTKVLIKD